MFGDVVGNSDADAILAHLRSVKPIGMTRKDIINTVFGNHISAVRLSNALNLLLKEGRARCERKTTSGRPAEVWHVA